MADQKITIAEIKAGAKIAGQAMAGRSSTSNKGLLEGVLGIFNGIAMCVIAIISFFQLTINLIGEILRIPYNIYIFVVLRIKIFVISGGILFFIWLTCVCLGGGGEL